MPRTSVNSTKKKSKAKPAVATEPAPAAVKPAKKKAAAPSVEEIIPLELDDATTSEIQGAVAAARSKKQKGPPSDGAVLYLGHIPHGFYEEQMRGFFGQFGTVTRLRLSRNKKTGRSKHYAFVEFKHAEVAQVVAKSMNGYLLYTKILECHVVPPEDVHPETFKSAGRPFKQVDWTARAQAAQRGALAGRGAGARGAARAQGAAAAAEARRRRHRVRVWRLRGAGGAVGEARARRARHGGGAQADARRAGGEEAEGARGGGGRRRGEEAEARAQINYDLKARRLLRM